MSEEQNNEIKDEVNLDFLVDEIKEDVVEEKEILVEEAPVEELTIKSDDKPKNTKPGLGPVGDGALGSTTINVEPKKKAAKTTPEVEKVAVYSTKNVTWNGVGKVYRGYNIVTKEQADQWTTRDHIRLATPQEVAKEFGL